MQGFEPGFQRIEQSQRSQAYVHGLLGNATRKNVEQMALGMGEKVQSMQYFVGQSPWEAEPVIDIHQQNVGETLGEEDGVALIDESSVVKQVDDSVGVARQYCGSVGQVERSWSLSHPLAPAQPEPPPLSGKAIGKTHAQERLDSCRHQSRQ